MKEVKLFDNKEQVIENLKTAILNEAEKNGTADELLKFADISEITSKAEYDTAKKGKSAVTKYITSVKNTRLELTRQIDEVKKEFIDFEKQLTEPIEKIKTHLTDRLTDFEQAEERRLQERYEQRLNELTANGYELIGNVLKAGIFQLSSDDLKNMEDEDFPGWVEKGKQEKDRIDELKRQEEEARRELEEARRKLDEEREALRKEMEELRKLKDELKAQEVAAEVAYKEPDPMVTTPAIEFEQPIHEPEPTPEPIEPVIDVVSYNQGVNDVIKVFETNSGLKKQEYIELFKGLIK